METTSDFTQCMLCGTSWVKRIDFLCDDSTKITAYKADFNNLEQGEFLFHHEKCGGTVSLPAVHFKALYDGPVYTERKTGTDDCPDYCYDPQELKPCPEECECAHVREIIRVISDWAQDQYRYDIM